jgi:hypothetical protein
MKKIILSLATLAAVSSSAFAFQNRSADLRDIEPFNGGVSESVMNYSDTSPLAAVGGEGDTLKHQAINELYDSHGQRR